MTLQTSKKHISANVWIWGSTVVLILLLFLIDHLVGFRPIVRLVKHLHQNPLAALLFTVVYIIDYSLLPLGFMPVASGAIFGFAKGALIANIAENLGALLPFLATRKFSHKSKDDTAVAAQSKYLDPAMGNFWSVFVARFIGLPHYVVINYAAAFSTIRVRDYVIANFFGMLLWLIGITYFSDRLWAATIHGGEAAFRHKLFGALWPLLFIKVIALLALYGIKRRKDKLSQGD